MSTREMLADKGAAGDLAKAVDASIKLAGVRAVGYVGRYGFLDWKIKGLEAHHANRAFDDGEPCVVSDRKGAGRVARPPFPGRRVELLCPAWQNLRHFVRTRANDFKERRDAAAARLLALARWEAAAKDVASMAADPNVTAGYALGREAARAAAVSDVARKTRSLEDEPGFLPAPARTTVAKILTGRGRARARSDDPRGSAATRPPRTIRAEARGAAADPSLSDDPRGSPRRRRRPAKK